MKIIAATQPTVALYELGRSRVILWAVNEITLLVVGLVIGPGGVVVRADSLEGFTGYADD